MGPWWEDTLDFLAPVWWFVVIMMAGIVIYGLCNDTAEEAPEQFTETGIYYETEITTVSEQTESDTAIDEEEV